MIITPRKFVQLLGMWPPKLGFPFCRLSVYEATERRKWKTCPASICAGMTWMTFPFYSVSNQHGCLSAEIRRTTGIIWWWFFTSVDFYQWKAECSPGFMGTQRWWRKFALFRFHYCPASGENFVPVKTGERTTINFVTPLPGRRKTCDLKFLGEYLLILRQGMKCKPSLVGWFSSNGNLAKLSISCWVWDSHDFILGE